MTDQTIVAETTTNRYATPVTRRRVDRMGSLLLTVAIIVLYVALRMNGLLRYPLWGGETFLLDGVRMGWGAMLQYLIHDVVHPPLPYAILKLWIALGGESLLWLKLFAVLPAVATVAPLLLLLRELKASPFETNLVLFLAAVNGYLIHYAQEVRMYSLFMFFAVTSGWLFVRYYNAEQPAGRDLMWLTAVNLVLVYTHYFGWFMVGIELMVVALGSRRKLGWFASSFAALIALFLPWALLVGIEFSGRVGEVVHIPKPSRHAIAYLYANYNGPLELWQTIRIGLLLFAVPIAWWLVRVLRRGTDPHERLMFWWLAICVSLPIALGLAVYLLPVSFWYDRYFVFIAPFYLMLVAGGVHRMRPVALRAGYAAVLMIWAVIAGVKDITTDRVAWMTPQLGSRLDWVTAARELAAAAASDPAPVSLYALPTGSKGLGTGQWAIFTSLPFHMEPDTRQKIRFGGLATVDQLFGQPLDRTFWVAGFDLERPAGPIPEERLRDIGYEVVNTLRIGRPGHSLVLSHVARRDSLEAY